MKRTIALAALFTLAALLVLAGCSLGGTANNAGTKLSSGAQQALNKFNAALSQLKSLDVVNATKQELQKAQADVTSAWADVKARSSEFGQQRWNDLQSGYAKVSKALTGAINGSSSSLSQAEADLKSAVNDVSARLKQFWGDLLKVL